MTLAPRPAHSWVIHMVVVTALVGIGAGIGGLVVSAALHGIEHLAYGYSVGTFLDGIGQAPPGQRVAVLVIAGAIGGVGWWALRRWGASIVSVEQSIAGRRRPPLSTVVNTGLQVIIVGLGASIGREVAPRELGAAIAGWLSEKAGVTVPRAADPGRLRGRCGPRRGV